jgi:hypothetical protein
MPLASSTAENAAISGIIALTGHFISLHSASPSTTGANEIGTTTRQSVTWGTPASGVSANTNAISLAQAASTTSTHFGDWSLVSAGTYYIGGALSPTVTTGSSAGTVTAAIGALTMGAA